MALALLGGVVPEPATLRKNIAQLFSAVIVREVSVTGRFKSVLISNHAAVDERKAARGHVVSCVGSQAKWHINVEVFAAPRRIHHRASAGNVVPLRRLLFPRINPNRILYDLKPRVYRSLVSGCGTVVLDKERDYRPPLRIPLENSLRSDREVSSQFAFGSLSRNTVRLEGQKQSTEDEQATEATEPSAPLRPLSGDHSSIGSLPLGAQIAVSLFIGGVALGLIFRAMSPFGQLVIRRRDIWCCSTYAVSGASLLGVSGWVWILGG